MPTVILSNGESRTFDDGIDAAGIAQAIAPSLAKKAVACRMDGALVDLTESVREGSQLEFIAREEESALDLIRHDCAHLLAQAVLQLFPEVQPTIGPVIENGFFYDFYRPTPFSEEDLEKIEKKMKALVHQKIPIQREVWTRKQAIDYYQERQETFKVELVEAIDENDTISFYRQGDFLDLCRGPHMRHTGDVGQAFKLTRVAGSYWRGDSSKPQLQRIYGTAWRTPQELEDYLKFLEEAKRRDHRQLGRQMGLFHLQDLAAGMIFWHDSGWTIYRLLENYIRHCQREDGYQEVKTPQLIDRKLWEQSGHWDKFRENMYIADSEEGLKTYFENLEQASVFALKPMNCPGHVQIYKQGIKSYRDLPLRIAEFGSCHRCEPSGALHGIMRVRNFVQDDGHIFCTESQIASETVQFVHLLEKIYSDLGFDEFKVNFADRPAIRAGSDATWDKAEQSLKQACEKANLSWDLNAGDGAFYGPKLEFVLKDAIGREWQCGTWQVDFVLPERLDAEFTSEAGERLRPVMCHRAIIGSFERFIGILLEHHAGHLPLWLSPLQVVIATITSEANDYAQQLLQRLSSFGVRCVTDCRNEKISYKVREHSAAKVPILWIVGKREIEENKVSIRRLGSTEQKSECVENALNELLMKVTPPGAK